MKYKIALLFALAILLYLALFASACFSPADNYAVEVVLNKPNITYDISKLEKIEGIQKVHYGYWAKTAYAYKSRYNPNLIVVVSIQGLKYANIGSKPTLSVSIRSFNVSPTEIVSRIKECSLSWKKDLKVYDSTAVCIFSKKIKVCEVRVDIKVKPSSAANKSDIEFDLWIIKLGKPKASLAQKIKSEVDALLKKISLSTLGSFIKVKAIENALIRETPIQEEYIAIRIQIPIKALVEVTTVHSCRVTYSSEKLNVSKLNINKAKDLSWKILAEKANKNYIIFVLIKELEKARLSLSGKGFNNTIVLEFRVVGLSNLTENVLEEYRKVLNVIGVDFKLVNGSCFEKYSESTSCRFVPAVNISESDLKKALEVELKWLIENNIVSGLSNKDLEEIISAAKIGYAGWNSRLVWYNSKWIPYLKMPGAALVRCLSAPPAIFTQVEYSESPSTGPQEEKVTGKPLDFWYVHLLVLATAVAAAIIAYYIARKKLSL